jgi:hypothetical protein
MPAAVAKDPRRVWFDAIRQANSIQVSRLLYSTPTPDAGIDRLSYTLLGGTSDEDLLLEDLAQSLSKSLPETKHADRAQFVFGSAAAKPFLQGMDGLSMAVLLYFGDAVRSTRRKEVMDAIVGVCLTIL